MNEDEYAELLRYVRSRLERIGRPDLDEFAFANVVGAERPSDAFIKYATALLQQVHLESREGVIGARQRLNFALREADAGFIEDIVLVPSEQERVTIQRDAVPLEEALPSRAEFIAELGRFIREMDAERGRS